MKGEDGAAPSGQVGSCATLHGLHSFCTYQHICSCMLKLRSASGHPAVVRACMCTVADWWTRPCKIFTWHQLSEGQFWTSMSKVSECDRGHGWCGQAMTREQELAEMPAGESDTATMGPLRLRYPPGGTTSASDMEAGLVGCTAEPISRYESKPPKDAGKHYLQAPHPPDGTSQKGHRSRQNTAINLKRRQVLLTSYTALAHQGACVSTYISPHLPDADTGLQPLLRQPSLDLPQR